MEWYQSSGAIQWQAAHWWSRKEVLRHLNYISCRKVDRTKFPAYFSYGYPTNTKWWVIPVFFCFVVIISVSFNWFKIVKCGNLPGQSKWISHGFAIYWERSAKLTVYNQSLCPDFIRTPLLSRINLIPTWISNYMSNKEWDKITYQFPNFNGCTVEIWEGISNFILHFIMDIIIYPCWD